jgi:hypothetical protein
MMLGEEPRTPASSLGRQLGLFQAFGDFLSERLPERPDVLFVRVAHEALPDGVGMLEDPMR